MPGQRLDDVGRALHRDGRAAAVALDEDRDRHRGDGRERGGGAAVERGVRPRPGGSRPAAASRTSPGRTSRRARRRAARSRPRAARPARARPAPSTARARTRTAGRAMWLRRAVAGAPAPGRLADEHHQPEQHEHERERAADGRRVAALELGVDLRRERLEAEDLEGAELGQQDQRHEQHPAEQRRPDLVQRHAEERPQPPAPEPARDVLEARVGAPQRRRDRQVDERVAAERHHEHRSPVPVHGGVDRDPAVGDHEVRHRQRQHEHDRPEAPPGQVRSARRTRRLRRRSPRRRRDRDREPDRVPDQRQRQVPEDQRLSVAQPTCAACISRKTSGSSTATTTTVPAPSRLGGAGRASTS